MKRYFFVSYLFGETGKGGICYETEGTYLNRQVLRNDTFIKLGKPIVINNIIELNESDFNDFVYEKINKKVIE